MTLRVAPFDEALRDAGEHDFVYLDPPYAPVSATARFTSYTAGGFDADQQQLLQRTAIRLACRRASVLLSNSAAPQIRALYTRQPAKIAGLKATTVAARRAINSRASSRGPVREYLITNVGRRPACSRSGRYTRSGGPDGPLSPGGFMTGATIRRTLSICAMAIGLAIVAAPVSAQTGSIKAGRRSTGQPGRRRENHAGQPETPTASLETKKQQEG